jgi:hypothetical protein
MKSIYEIPVLLDALHVLLADPCPYWMLESSQAPIKLDMFTFVTRIAS